jgi:hypothetical protein
LTHVTTGGASLRLASENDAIASQDLIELLLIGNGSPMKIGKIGKAE